MNWFKWDNVFKMEVDVNNNNNNNADPTFNSNDIGDDKFVGLSIIDVGG